MKRTLLLSLIGLSVFASAGARAETTPWVGCKAVYVRAQDEEGADNLLEEAKWISGGESSDGESKHARLEGSLYEAELEYRMDGEDTITHWTATITSKQSGASTSVRGSSSSNLLEGALSSPALGYLGGDVLAIELRCKLN